MSSLFGVGSVAIDATNQQYSDMNPTSVPLMNVPTHVNLQPYVPSIGATLINELQTLKAQSNLRMYLFNQMAVNGYQNEEFAELFTVTVNAVLMFLRDYPQNSVENTIITVVQDIVAGRAAANIRLAPHLAQTVSPQIQFNVEKAYQYWLEVVRRVSTMIRQNQPAGQSQVVGNVGQQMLGLGGVQDGGLFSARNTNTANSPIHEMVANVAGVASAPANKWDQQLQMNKAQQAERANQEMTPLDMALASVIREPETCASVEPKHHFKPRVPPSIVTVLDTRQEEFIVPVAPEATPQVTQTQTQSSSENKFYSETDVQSLGLTWRPTAAQYHRPTYNLYRQRQQYVVVDDVPYCVIQNLSADQSKMDEQAHSLSSRYIALNMAPKETPVEEAVRSLSSPVLPRIKIERDKKREFDVTLAAAVSSVSMGTLSEENPQDDENTVYIKPHYICDLIHAKSPEVAKNYHQYFNKISSFSKFDELATFLEGLKNPEDLLFRHHTNIRLTNYINQVLCLQLGLDKVKITNFTEDIRDLIAGLEEHYGALVSKALESSYENAVAVSCTVIEENTSYQLLRFYNDCDERDSEGQYLKLPDRVDESIRSVALFGQTADLIWIPKNSHELNVLLRDDVGLMLTASASPYLYAVAEAVFQEDNKDKSARRVLVTKDGVAMHLARGLLNADCYIVQVIAFL